MVQPSHSGHEGCASRPHLKVSRSRDSLVECDIIGQWMQPLRKKKSRNLSWDAANISQTHTVCQEKGFAYSLLSLPSLAWNMSCTTQHCPHGFPAVLLRSLHIPKPPGSGREKARNNAGYGLHLYLYAYLAQEHKWAFGGHRLTTAICFSKWQSLPSLYSSRRLTIKLLDTQMASQTAVNNWCSTCSETEAAFGKKKKTKKLAYPFRSFKSFIWQRLTKVQSAAYQQSRVNSFPRVPN